MTLPQLKDSFEVEKAEQAERQRVAADKDALELPPNSYKRKDDLRTIPRALELSDHKLKVADLTECIWSITGLTSGWSRWTSVLPVNCETILGSAKGSAIFLPMQVSVNELLEIHFSVQPDDDSPLTCAPGLFYSY